jgi:two-component system, chemotaxis family, response regulator Rcp1
MVRLMTRDLEVLLIEDNPGDVRLIQEALRGETKSIKLAVAKDGLEAMDQLRPARFIPDLILLDLNLPRRSGHEVLLDIKSAPALKRVPVIVLSSSEAQDDVVKAYEGCANCYIVKPLDFDTFQMTIQQIIRYWQHVVTLPSLLN